MREQAPRVIIEAGGYDPGVRMWATDWGPGGVIFERKVRERFEARRVRLMPQEVIPDFPAEDSPAEPVEGAEPLEV